METEGLRQIAVSGGFEEVWSRLLARLAELHTPVFAVIDHAKNARSAGLDMPETRVAVFGNPAAGTKLMLAAPSCAVDLPLRMALRQEKNQVVLSWNEPVWTAKRHGIAINMPAVPAIAAFVESLAKYVAGVQD